MPTTAIVLILMQLLLTPFNMSHANPEKEYLLREEVPVLMYHEIGTPSGPWKELYVEPAVFAQQLDYLAQEGYTTISLENLYDHWYKEKPLPEKPIILTFDDGYKSMYEKVFPLLLARKMQGTFFLYPSKFDTSNGLTPQMVKEMAQKGMEIGSHTLNHVDLTKVKLDQQKKELSHSKKILEELTEKPIHFLCYPAGRYNGQVIEEVQKHGYWGAVTTQMGKTFYQQDPYSWKRIRINYSDGLQGFIKKIQ